MNKDVIKTTMKLQILSNSLENAINDLKDSSKEQIEINNIIKKVLETYLPDVGKGLKELMDYFKEIK